MKAIILAGGAGDRLWPLSRRNFPKQFLQLNNGNSMFQETVIRNIPFCDEFIIVTNREYQEIVEGQMKQFQGIAYRTLVEEHARGTAPAVAQASHLIAEEELVFVLPADLMIQGDGYSEAIYHAKELAEQGNYVLFGTRAEEPKTSYGYIRYEGNRVLRFIEKPSKAVAERIFYQDDILWNSGMILCPNQLLRSELADRCGTQNQKRIHIEKVLLEQSAHLAVVPLRAMWQDISNFQSYAQVVQARQSRDTVMHACENTTVFNNATRQLVVANGLSDLFVVNTDDAIYITKKETEQDIKSIMTEAPTEYQDYFRYSPKMYRNWGIREMISQAPGYRVRRLVLYPGATLSAHTHTHRNENYSVIKGVLSVEMDGRTVRVGERESINVLPSQMHRLYNDTDQDVVAIEVDTGAEIDERDMVHQDEMADMGKVSLPQLYRMQPTFKDYLWGGKRLVTQFGKKSPYEITAESWELSAHPDGQSVIAGGSLDGMRFGDFVAEYGVLVCGWKSKTFDRFPILIKFIDACNPLSVQIHPYDDYAFTHESEFGKNEMWYVMDAEPGAFLYCGFARAVSAEEVRRRLADHTITDVLNKVPVQKGDVIFIPAGTIHAIGAGILICEIQQNSNSTYRVYDYDRVDKNGKHRELHVDKALDVMTFSAYEQGAFGLQEPRADGDNLVQQLCVCKYFQCEKYEIRKRQLIYVTDASFVSLVFLAGKATVSTEEEQLEASAGDSIFVTAGRKVIHIDGSCEVIATMI